MSLITLVQTACKRVGLPSPNAVYSSTDENVVRMLALSNEGGEEIAQRYPWQRLVNESTFTSAATESQGAITTLAGTDFGWIVNDTVWNRTQMMQWFPILETEWAAMKASSVTGPYPRFLIRGNALRAIPTPTAGHTIAFEWVSKNWCQSSGGTAQSAWAADTDTGIIDEGLLTADLIWRWKAAQGLDYAEDFRKCEGRIENAMSRDGAKKHLNFHGRRGTRFLTNRSIPAGNFS